MSSRYLIQGMTVLLACFILASGCAPKIVRPNPVPQPGFRGPQVGGPVMEQELQVIQTSLQPIYFSYDSYALSPEAQATLQQNAEILRRAPQVSVVADGHCDERGTAEYNLALGDRRARSAVEFLATAGIAPNRLSTVSYGSELPVDPAHNEEAWAKNRRVYLRVSR
jgi:peptidoglycan-associated lipoprotein